MIDYQTILNIPPYAYQKEEKEKFLTPLLKELTIHHDKNCPEYHNMLKALQFSPLDGITTYEELPFLPVSLFKTMTLRSISEENIVKTMTSSGTTGQAVSKIVLDKETAGNQQKTLVKIISDYTGSTRMPMLIIDCPSVIKNRNLFSARGAGILGFSIFGAHKTYALDDEMHLNIEEIKSFLEKHQGKKILLFGFTFMIWEYFYKALKKTNQTIDLSQGILIHGGGWKKLQKEAVASHTFKEELKTITGIKEVHDYYGMVEQTGVVYMECEAGHLHASIFSDIITRRPLDFSLCEIGEKGIIQVLSILPKSYPGHSLLTEDEGIILGEDDCPCGRLGKYFKIEGRLKNAEIRGCSDTYEN